MKAHTHTTREIDGDQAWSHQRRQPVWQARFPSPQHLMSMATAITPFMIGLVLLISLGCASPTPMPQAVVDEPSLFVGLTRLPDTQPTQATPSMRRETLSASTLHAILNRLFIRKGSGLLDGSIPIHPVFSPEEAADLATALQQALGLAGPDEWVGFGLWGSSQPTQTLEVTSGGMFLDDRTLHIVLANHRERVSSEEDGIIAIRNNPFHALQDRQGTLMFHPAGVVLSSGTRWMAGGFASPTSELILDYHAFLASTNTTSSATDGTGPVSNRARTTQSAPLSPEAETELLRKELSELKAEWGRRKGQPSTPSESLAQPSQP
jgi:hypothetical protein